MLFWQSMTSMVRMTPSRVMWLRILQIESLERVGKNMNKQEQRFELVKVALESIISLNQSLTLDSIANDAIALADVVMSKLGDNVDEGPKDNKTIKMLVELRGNQIIRQQKEIDRLTSELEVANNNCEIFKNELRIVDGTIAKLNVDINEFDGLLNERVNRIRHLTLELRIADERNTRLTNELAIVKEKIRMLMDVVDDDFGKGFAT
jgi:chromosome segregation ATPase